MSTSRKVGGMILIAVIYFVFDTLLQAGFFKSISNEFNGSEIHMYENVWGGEDIEWDRTNNLIYISATDRWQEKTGAYGEKDGIYVLVSNSNSSVPVIMKTDFSGDFHPHGISLFNVQGEKYLYAVNHSKESNTVELFKIDSNFLTHIESYSDKLMTSPNDVVGDEIGKFYVTNDHGNTSENGRTVEEYLRMPYSYLLYYNGTKFSKAHKGLVYANGVQLSNDGSILYVSHTIGHEIFVLERRKSNGLLIVKDKIDLGTGVDNIDVDENGVLWVASHPKLLDFTAYANDSTKISPSEVFKIEEVEKKFEVTKIYENDGSQLSGSSIAVAHNDTIFIGSVFGNQVLKLKMK
jgi:arylesterase/paraoxonase